ncbi:hypothetical protein CE91St41_00570 [Oscillospiraceae bacterium]|nr:hypothetical protein CE91St40_00570 [Oscillospiraceae bacterium]BDF73168.1 hypothetical protein CE91St41_00570 [Oscillospiraceae bacterium]
MKRYACALQFLTSLALAAALAGCAPPEPAPSPTPDPTCLEAFQDAAADPRRLLASRILGEKTVAAVVVPSPGTQSYSSTFLLGSLDSATGAAEEVALSLPVPRSDSSPVWLRFAEGSAGLEVQILAETIGEDSMGRQGGGLRYDGGRWTWIWPACPTDPAYDAYWASYWFQAFDSAPFRILPENTGRCSVSLLEEQVAQRVVPGWEARGVPIWGYELCPRLLEALPDLDGYGTDPAVWAMDYRLLPADADAARAAGAVLDGQGWILPEADALDASVFTADARQLCTFPMGGGADQDAVAHARTLLSAPRPAPGGDGLPAVDGAGRYDPETGFYYNDAGGFGLWIAPGHRDGYLFYQEEVDGALEVAVYYRPLYAWWLAHGGAVDGCVRRIRVVDAARYARDYEQGVYYASGGVRELCVCLNVYPFAPVFHQGRFYVQQPTSLFADFPLDSPVQAALLEEARTAATASARMADMDNTVPLLDTFFVNEALPTDLDFTLMTLDGALPFEAWNRFGIGTQGALPLGEPRSVRTSTRYTAAPGDRWERADYGDLTATYYVTAAGEKTVTALDATGPYSMFRRGVCVGADDFEARICFDGGDYGYALEEPLGQLPAANPYRFFITETESGVPLPCPYRLNFYLSDGVISRIEMYADLLGGADPFD